MLDAVKDFVKRVPLLGPAAKKLYFAVFPPHFETSGKYWEERYVAGGSSGPGSYSRLAQSKAQVLNTFVRDNGVKSVVEFGCGDGSQLELADYPSYLGVDVSPFAVKTCAEKFHADPSKQFIVLGAPIDKAFDLSLSLDVVYHLVEDSVFAAHMAALFDSSHRFVVIYSSNFDKDAVEPHIKHRQFSAWIEENRPAWRLKQKIANEYPFSPHDPSNTSFADFYIYERRS